MNEYQQNIFEGIEIAKVKRSMTTGSSAPPTPPHLEVNYLDYVRSRPLGSVERKRCEKCNKRESMRAAHVVTVKFSQSQAFFMMLCNRHNALFLAEFAPFSNTGTTSVNQTAKNARDEQGFEKKDA